MRIADVIDPFEIGGHGKEPLQLIASAVTKPRLNSNFFEGKGPCIEPASTNGQRSESHPRQTASFEENEDKTDHA